MAKVRLEGHLDVPPDRLEQVRAALPAHIALTLAEPGCLAFTVTESLSRPARFLVRECFVDQAALDAHGARASQTHWAQVTAGIPRHYTITHET